ncbi:hypothetical protein JCM10908_006452 [Rhodotorula pacifica]|uniref:uncharacterized protein n=1 Tax=Rhodotorula pacifica TaxID=1495444 RepID=UPI00317990B8
MTFLKRLRSRTNATEVTPTSSDAARTDNDWEDPPDLRAETPPPPFSFPTSYPVGTHTRKEARETLFLTHSDVLTHLRLLEAFHHLRKLVEAASVGIAGNLDSRARWSFFVEVSVYRLELYVRALAATENEGEADHFLPPLDVCLVLHAYILNPFCFAEDTLRVFPQLRSAPRTLLSDVASAIDPTSLQFMADPSQQHVWSTLTNTPFDPIQHFATATSRLTPEIHGFTSTEVAWLKEDGTGYAQQGFRAVSPEGIEYTHASLGVMRLAADVYECKVNPLATMAGTVLSPWSLPDQPAGAQGARWVATRLARTLEAQQAQSPLDVANALRFDRKIVEQVFQKALGLAKQTGVEGILCRYRRGEPFSPHLSVAVLRQAEITAALDRLGWLQSDRLSNTPALLDRAIARYHGFMDLIAANPLLTAIPTVDIELTWQTHMLKSSYFPDTKGHVGRYVDQDSAIEESALAQLFDETSEAWAARYNVPYSACSCAVLQKAFQPKRILSSFKARANGTASSAASDTKAEYSADGYTDANATHLSELLSVVYANSADSRGARQKRSKPVTSQKQTAANVRARPPCPLGEHSAGLSADVKYGLSGYGSTSQANGLITHASFADPSASPGPDAFGPFAVAGLGFRSASFSGRTPGMGMGVGWQSMAIGGGVTGLGAAGVM